MFYNTQTWRTHGTYSVALVRHADELEEDLRQSLALSSVAGYAFFQLVNAFCVSHHLFSSPRAVLRISFKPDASKQSMMQNMQ
jgi:hypothetical protein